MQTPPPSRRDPRRDRARSNGSYHNGSTPHAHVPLDDTPDDTPDAPMKPGVHDLQPGWLAFSMAAGALLWVGMIAVIRGMIRRTGRR